MGTLFKRADRGDKWYGQFVDHNGERTIPKSTGTSDKATAKRILAKWESDAALRREGCIDPSVERLSKQSQRPLREHLKDFRASLESAGKTRKHIAATSGAVEAVKDKFEWESLSDIKIEDVEAFGSEMRAANSAGRTIQRKLAALKQFTKWCLMSGRIVSDPLASLKTPSPKTDRRLERRALRPEEWPLLRDSTEAGALIPCGLTGPQRALLYELAIQTGLRSNELRSLTRGKLHLEQLPQFVLVPSRSTKNRKPARQYISRALGDRLSAHIKQTEAGAPLFTLPHETGLAAMLRTDLTAARDAWLNAAKTSKEQLQREKTDFLLAVDHEGHAFDFHGLRHTCGAWLAMAGENPKTIQSIMRHSSITLTMDTYGHLFPAAESDAIGRLGAKHFCG